MIATTVFSMVLLLCTYGLLQISRVYHKGVTESRVQDALRTITDDISRAIQFNSGSVTPTPDSDQITPGEEFVFCVGDQRYSVVTDRQLVDGNPDIAQSQVRHVLVVDTVAGCNGGTTPQDPMSTSINGRELLSPNMRLSKFEVLDQGNNLYEINARVIYGDDDLLNDTRTSCTNVRAGTQFCAVGELNTVVQKRL